MEMGFGAWQKDLRAGLSRSLHDGPSLTLQGLLALDGTMGFGLFGVVRLLAETVARALPVRIFGAKPRLVFLSNERFSLPSGRSRCFEMAELLQEKGYDARSISVGDRYFPHHGGQFTRLSDTEKIYANLRLVWDLRHDLDAILYVQKAHYHVLAPLELHRAAGTRLVMDFDDYDWENNPNRFKFLYRFPTFASRNLGISAMQKAIFCTAASHDLTERVGAVNPRTRFLPIGIRLDRFPVFPPRNGPDVVFSWMGSLMHRENLDTLETLAKIFASIESTVPRKLLISATGTWLPEFRRRVDGVQRLEIREWGPVEGIPPFVGEADIGLVPLFAETGFAKAKNPIKLFEYQAGQRAVIASRFGEAGLTIRHGVDGLLAGDEGEFRDCMTRLLEDRSLRLNLAHAGRKRVEEGFDQRVLAARLAGWFDESHQESIATVRTT